MTPEIEKLYEKLRQAVGKCITYSQWTPGAKVAWVREYVHLFEMYVALESALAPKSQPKVGQWRRFKASGTVAGIVVDANRSNRVRIDQDIYTGEGWFDNDDLEPCPPDWRVMHPKGPPVPGSKVQVVEHPVEEDGQTPDSWANEYAGRTGVVEALIFAIPSYPERGWVLSIRFDSEFRLNLRPWNCRSVEDAK